MFRAARRFCVRSLRQHGRKSARVRPHTQVRKRPTQENKRTEDWRNERESALVEDKTDSCVICMREPFSQYRALHPDILE
jgi:hypothetical protein